MKKKLIYALSLALLVGPVMASVEKANYNPTDEAVSVDITKKEKEKVEDIKEKFNITEAYEDFNLIKEPINSDKVSTYYLNKKTKNKPLTPTNGLTKNWEVFKLPIQVMATSTLIQNGARIKMKVKILKKFQKTRLKKS